jgi:hypothetical protein
MNSYSPSSCPSPASFSVNKSAINCNLPRQSGIIGARTRHNHDAGKRRILLPNLLPNAGEKQMEIFFVGAGPSRSGREAAASQGEDEKILCRAAKSWASPHEAGRAKACWPFENVMRAKIRAPIDCLYVTTMDNREGLAYRTRCLL